MNTPTLGITVIIVLVFVTLSQLLFQGSRQRTRHEELKALLERIETLLNR